MFRNQKFHKKIAIFANKIIHLQQKRFNPLIFKAKNSALCDEDLLNQFLNSANQEVYGTLYSRYIPLVYGLGLKYLQNREEAEDAVMQIYEETVAKVANYDIKNYRTWLYSVAKNHCLQLLRKNENRSFEPILPEIMESEEFLHLLDETQDEETIAALTHCLKTLTEEQQSCIKSFFFENCSYADIVDSTGYALSKVKSYIQNGKRNLKICMVKVLNL